jgi:general secretion pathway protein L
MIQVFLRWWVEQLFGLVPPSLRLPNGRPLDALVLSVEGSTVTASLRKRRRSESIGRFENDQRGAARLRSAVERVRERHLETVLHLPSDEILRKSVTLPLAARRNIRQVLEFEMAHETPFDAEDVVWAYDIRHQDRISERLDIDLTLVPRAAIGRVGEFTEAAGLTVAAVEICDGDRVTQRLALDNQSAGGPGTPRINAALAALFGLLTIAAGAAPFVRLEQSLLDRRNEVAQLRTTADTSLGLKKEIDRLSSAANFITAARSRVRDPLAVMAAATDAIPNDTYLTEFSLHGDKITLVGLSPAAANLIATLSAVPPFHDPAFGAPVVRPEGTKLELFTINSALAPMGDQR